MKQLKILSWNVNGIRAAVKKGFLDWLQQESPDILCVQETKAHTEQLDTALTNPEGYHVFWNYPEKKGYSGVATFSRDKPEEVAYDPGMGNIDGEGRILMTVHGDITLFNIYFPNGKKDAERLKYKLDFYDTFLDYIEPMRKEGRKLVICGDYNTAHKEIDLAHPKANEKVSGFLPVEREWLTKLTENGYVDTFRHFNREPEQYTWWDQKSRARERNIGWRIDYFFITGNLVGSLSDAFIMPEVEGSDHCPVGILLYV
ncbi:MAG: exodeoxyribonuclease III [Dehalococcoidales bacterium]|nr:exodeoxyribonuclease III [Dehalococcoidales bacterium]